MRDKVTWITSIANLPSFDASQGPDSTALLNIVILWHKPIIYCYVYAISTADVTFVAIILAVSQTNSTRHSINANTVISIRIYALLTFLNLIWPTFSDLNHDLNPSVMQHNFVLDLSPSIWVSFDSYYQVVPHRLDYYEKLIKNWNCAILQNSEILNWFWQGHSL